MPEPTMTPAESRRHPGLDALLSHVADLLPDDDPAAPTTYHRAELVAEGNRLVCARCRRVVITFLDRTARR